ncbi:MAG: ABC transporter ATP-binding protein [Deltaproteobacteria bacterium]|nr:ABC transporter ATP-binding protein [Deltaproteobacteria bacterium]
MLKLKNVTVHYDKAKAVENVSLEIAAGRLITLIGSNGAGKSTILRALSGLKSISTGEIWFQERKIDGLAVHEIVKCGLIHVPEGRRLFSQLSVLANLKLGAVLRSDAGGIKRDMEEIFGYFPIIRERLHQKAGTLSGGEQQMLAIGRGLMAKPKLLLLDEPSLGLAPLVVQELGLVIKRINRSGITVVLVEQNAPLALGIADQGYVLQVGKIVLAGDSHILKQSDLVQKAYLGD